MPDEELNGNNPEENELPPGDEEIDAAGRADDSLDNETSDEKIAEPSLDGLESESAAEDSSGTDESSFDSTGELTQEEIDAAFNSTGEDKHDSENTSADAGDSVSVPVLDGADSVVGSEKSFGSKSDQQAEGDINIIRAKDFEDFGASKKIDGGQNIEMLLDVTLPVAIELGRTSMPIEDILNLGPGSVVELNRLAGEPVDLLVNDKLIAKGEVVVVDENFGVRVTSMVSQEERLKGLI